jgi:hypothetical protein
MGLLKFKQTIFSKTHFTGGRVTRYRTCVMLHLRIGTQESATATVNICYSSGG